MKRGQWAAVAFFVSVACAGLSFCQSSAGPGVVFSIEEWAHWAPVLGADAPAFTLYENRDLIYFNDETGRYETVQLSEDEYERLIEEIIPRDLAAMDDDYSRVMVTCQNLYFFYFGGTPPRMVTVYGHPTYNYTIEEDNWVLEIPQSLRRCFHAVSGYRNCRAAPWVPEKIEVLVWNMWPSNQKYVDWPTDWPDLNSPDTIRRSGTSSIFLGRDLYDEFMALLDESGGVVMMNGRPMVVWYRLPIPGEEIFDHVFDDGGEPDPGNTPLHIAASRRQLDTVRSLVEAGADVNVRNRNGHTPLHYAAQAGQQDVVEFLLASGAVVDATGNDGQTPLHWAVFNDCVDTAGLLLAAGADANARRRDGKTALHLAAEWGFSQSAKVLVANGADVEAKTPYGNTPLLCALDFREPSVAGVLLDKGADLHATNSVGHTGLHYATDDRLKDVAERLIVGGLDIDARNNADDTPLYSAALDGASQIVEILLTKGADVNAAKSDGRTPLHVAARRGHTQVVTLLIAHAASVNALTEEGHTPLDYALMAGREGVVTVLQDAGGEGGGGDACSDQSAPGS